MQINVRLTRFLIFSGKSKLNNRKRMWTFLSFAILSLEISCANGMWTVEPSREKTDNVGFRQGPT